MNLPKDIVQEMRERRVVAVVRLSNGDSIREVADALIEGGITCIEITMTVPTATRCIEILSVEYPGVLVGAGTVMSEEAVVSCADAGASFVVSPVLVQEVVAAARRLSLPVIPGAMTPTEVVSAWNAGAKMVKVFPAARLGSAYLGDLRGPLPDIPLLPTGGINDENIREYLDAGAAAVCVGSWLVCPDAVRDGNFGLITQKAQRLLRCLSEQGIGNGTGEGA